MKETGAVRPVSVALATLNGERFLQEQLASIEQQTVRPVEMVVCDDGSEDRTIDIIESFARTAPFPVRVFVNRRKLGYADNFLKAASLCAGDLIAFCDQDDVWLPGKLARCATAIEANRAKLVVHANALVDDFLRPLHEVFPKVRRNRVCSALRVDPRILSPGCAMVFTADLIRRIDWRERPRSKFGPEPMAHDQWIVFLASVLGRTAFIAEPLVLYRQHESNTYGAPDRRPGRMLSVVWNAGRRTYEGAAAAAYHHGTFLRDLAGDVNNDEVATRLRSGATFYFTLADRQLARARIYRHATRRARFTDITRLLAIGGYGRRTCANLGLRSFFKDVIVAAANRNVQNHGVPASAEDR